MQHGRFRAPDPGDPARGPATGDEGEEGPTHGEDCADEPELLPVHRLSNLIGAQGEAQKTDDQSDGQRGERPNPYGAPSHWPADPFRIAIVHESPPGSGDTTMFNKHCGGRVWATVAGVTCGVTNPVNFTAAFEGTE